MSIRGSFRFQWIAICYTRMQWPLFFELFVLKLTHLPQDKMAATLADDIFNCIFLNDEDRISIQISLKYAPSTQSPPIICHAPTASRREATRSYPTRWRPRLGENGKSWISKLSLNNITQILLHIKDYNICNSSSLTDMQLLPQK